MRLLPIPIVVVIASALMACTSARTAVPEHATKTGQPGRPETNARTHSDHSTLRVLTLNVAHGRRDARNQLVVNRETHEENLTDIARLLRQHDVDVAAFQEADGPSRWSGGFDHVEFVARQARYPSWVRVDHATNWLFSYGTAILSRWPIVTTLKHTFEPSPPTPNKGFVLAEVAWGLEPEHVVVVDVVSVHLDFSRKSVRDQQASELALALEGRKNPLIILGDFNSDWPSDGSVVKALVEKANLSAYQPEADGLHTYGRSSRRLDWVLISDGLRFADYRVLPDVVSDHFAVVAAIRLQESAEQRK